ncbi:glycosyltransferase [Rhodococcus kroppenstedtii]|uniref:glycosyltransferase n=1 Tax=Rhodococcoides kroppenstedtii TaxID=293050 RepID=UPI001C9A606A|nr:glycosyltransferase [Rhodococcus kroppenstedtii]MBY6437551.1 glycosyltransferase [Rhodococcus kroppenstedtii]
MREMPRDVSVLRIYESVRTMHVEQLHHMIPGHLIYRDHMYDWHFDDGTVPYPMHRASRPSIARAILGMRSGTVELNEPLMIRAWPTLLVTALALTTAKTVLRRPIVVSAYAIENNPPVPAVASYTHLPTAWVRWPTTAMIRLLCRSLDRIAFGTPAAERNLRTFAATSLPRDVMTMLELPTPCPVCLLRKERIVVALGEFSHRKGILHTMAAWDQLPVGHGLRLVMIGMGPLTDRVLRWADPRMDVDVLVDPPRQRIHDVLARARTLVLLSTSSARWREQIGLPITEGLAHGCEIVSTADTGFAPWLADHGHRIVESAASADVAGAIMDSTAGPDRAEDITTPLPDEDTRVTIDRWMHRR